MANRGKRGGAAASLSGNSAPFPSPASAAATVGPTAAASAAAPPAAHAPPASVWGKGGFNPLTSPASHAAAANGVSAAEKSKDKPASTSAATHSQSSAAAASAAASTAHTAAATLTSPAASNIASPSPSSSAVPVASSTSAAAAASPPNPATALAPTTTPTPAASFSTICQLGNTVAVITLLGERLEGVVYVYDAAAHILALEVTTAPHASSAANSSSGAKDYTLLNTHNLHVSLVHKPATPAPRRHLPPVDPSKLAQRETKALAQRSAEAAKIGHNVSAIGQRLFDALAKLYEARWDGTAIVLMGALRLEEPYGAEQLTGGSGQQRQRIVKTIEAQREKERK